MILRRTYWLALLLICLPLAAFADTVRVATFNAELQRAGPGLLLRDLTKPDDTQVNAVISVIARTAPDILALQGFDWDHEGAALAELTQRLGEAGVEFDYVFSRQPNSGRRTELDLDGDRRTGGPGDAQGYGEFTGQGGIAVLSRFPIIENEVQDLSGLLWRDLPGAMLPLDDHGLPFPSQDAWNIQRLSSTAHWNLPIQLPDGRRVHILTFQAGPPVFDGPEDRNGRRNHDEILLWLAHLDGTIGSAPETPFVIAGGANLDPFDSDGRNTAIKRLLADQRIQDPAPQSDGAAAAADQGHAGPNALDTVDWDGPGRLRVDYVLPSADLKIADAGVFWPTVDEPGHEIAMQASRHRLVWVDLAFD